MSLSKKIKGVFAQSSCCLYGNDMYKSTQSPPVITIVHSSLFRSSFFSAASAFTERQLSRTVHGRDKIIEPRHMHQSADAAGKNPSLTYLGKVSGFAGWQVPFMAQPAHPQPQDDFPFFLPHTILAMTAATAITKTALMMIVAIFSINHVSIEIPPAVFLSFFL